MEPESAEEWDTVSPAIALGERQSHNISDFSTDARAIWNANKDATSIPIMIGMLVASSEKVSEHQELIYDNDFMPKKPKEIETDGGVKKTIWVDNPDCEKATDIQASCGQEIYQEVGRAWLEVQDLRDETSGAQVPWNKNKKRMLDNDEIVMIQHAKCMILAGYKPSADTTTLTGEAASNRRKFRKIFKELKEQEEESDEESDEDNAATAERAMGNVC